MRTRLISLLLIFLLFASTSNAQTPPNWGGWMTGVADWQGQQFGSLNPFPFIVSAAQAASSPPRWNGPLTGIADSNGNQFGTLNPFPVTIIGGSSGITIGSTVITGCATTGFVLFNNAGKVGCESVGGTGTVTSVGLVLPSSILTVSGSPVTTSGNLTAVLATQVANSIWAGPTTGSAATPTFRSLVGADLPNPASSSLGGIQSAAGVSHQWISSISTSGVPGLTQPGISDLSGLGSGVATALGNTVNATGGLTTFGTDLPLAGGTLTGKLITTASVTGTAGLNLPQGTAPSAPVNGDVWATSSGVFAQIAGSTVGPFGTGGGASGANPTAIAGPTTNNGSATTFMRSDASPQIQKGTNTQLGLVEGDGQTVTCSSSGVCSVAAPNRSTNASFTILSTDMGGQVNFTGSTAAQIVTIPAISSTVLAAGMTVTICNQASVALTISSNPTINGYTPTTLPPVTNGTAACLSLTSNGTSLDAIAIQNTMAVSQVTGLGTNVGTALGTTLSAAGGLSSTIASGTSALGTGVIASAACASAVTTSATNTATTDVISWGFNGDPTGVTGYTPVTTGALTIFAYPSSNNVNFKVCNLTSGSITPGAITLNWRVIR
jgi:hypothetical protein